MERHRSLSSTALLGLVVLQGGLSLLGLVLTVLYIASSVAIAPSAVSLVWPLALCACLVPQVVLSSRARRLVSPEPGRALVLGFAIASALGVVGYYLFFHGPAHDVALWFGSHGRFGCTTVDGLGRRTTWLDDRTLPWLLSLPVPLTYLGWYVLHCQRGGSR